MEEQAGYLAAIFLAATLLRSGIAKLLRPSATSGEFKKIGLPRPDLLARSVPVFEIVTAAGLLIFPRQSAWVALGLLLAFSGVVIWMLAQGIAAGCGCFGEASDEEVSKIDLVRNALLLGLAVVATRATRPVALPIELIALGSSLFLVGVLGIAIARFLHRGAHFWSLGPQV